MKFFTQYDRPDLIEEVMSDDSITETAGYIPPERQIVDMINAGVRLGEFRKEAYDFGSGEEVPDDYIDPTRSPNFDMADAQAINLAVNKRLVDQSAAAVESGSIVSEQPAAEVKA